jgi:hypothetical protein
VPRRHPKRAQECGRGKHKCSRQIAGRAIQLPELFLLVGHFARVAAAAGDG